MSLHIVPPPLQPLAVRVIAALAEHGPAEPWQLVDRVIRPGLVTDADALVRDVLADLAALGMVRTDGERYWVVRP